jgi:hypothetical protein
VDATIDAFIPDPSAFEKLPTRPPFPFRAAGQEVLLVSTDEGKVVAAPGLDAVRRLRSFVSLECGVGVGSTIERTIDVFTQVGAHARAGVHAIGVCACVCACVCVCVWLGHAFAHGGDTEAHAHARV